MKKYHKIQTIYKRDTKGRLMLHDWATPEFEYLANQQWAFTEKVDGTNIRIMWNGSDRRFGGKTDNALLLASLVTRLEALFTKEKMDAIFGTSTVCLYGEGYGEKIQKGGCNYKADGQDFIMFDILVGSLWLMRPDVEDVGKRLGIGVVPIIGHGTLTDLHKKTEHGLTSTWGDFQAEGIVARPRVELQDRRGERIITKLKTKDFKWVAPAKKVEN